MQNHVSECWSRDKRIANWYENCKLKWKLQTHMKIANIHVGTIHQNVRIANWYENCKLTWKLQTDMRIAKAILTFWSLVPTWMFAIFIWDTAGMKTCSGTESMFRFDCGVDDKNSTKQSLTKDSYFNTNSYDDTVWRQGKIAEVKKSHVKYRVSASVLYCNKFVLQMYNLFCSCAFCFAVVHFSLQLWTEIAVIHFFVLFLCTFLQLWNEIAVVQFVLQLRN